MYIDAGLGQSNPIILTTITSGPKFPRSWRVRISQIHCGSIFKADQGCLQFHTGVNGRVRSFNFDTSSGRQLSNQDYSLCMRMERNFCSIQYTVCQDPSGTNRSRSFTLSGNSNTAVMAMVGGGTQGTPNSCSNDWLMVPCAKVAGEQKLITLLLNIINALSFNNELFNISLFTDRVPATMQCEDKICGKRFPCQTQLTTHCASANHNFHFNVGGAFNAEVSSVDRTVSSNIRPFRLVFHTDSVEAPNDVDNRGFCLDYIQQPCTNG